MAHGPIVILPEGARPLSAPATAHTREDRLAFWVRAAERMRLWHNDRPARTRGWIRTEFEPRTQVVLAHRNALLTDSSGLFSQRQPWPLDDPRGEALEAQRATFFLAAKEDTRWDNYICPEGVLGGEPAPEPPDPIENFTLYDETDEGGADITVTASRVSWTLLAKTMTSHVSMDQGPGHFGGNFSHLFEAELTTWVGNGGIVAPWMLANSQDDLGSIYGAGGSALALTTWRSGLDKRAILYEVDSGDLYSSAQDIIEGTPYFVNSQRVETTGPYGTIYAYIRTGSHSGTLLGTPTIALHTSKKNYRFNFACSSYNAAAAAALTGYTQNMDLQEEDPGAEAKVAYYHTRGGEGR